MSDYEWTDDMREISGFGGSYEAGCRAMVSAGARWLADHALENPRWQEFTNIAGIAIPDNEAAKVMERAMLDAEIDIEGKMVSVGEYGATGAMVQYSMHHALMAHRMGWAAYQAKSREMKAAEPADA